MLYEQAILTASDGTPDDNFGFSVAISGNTAIVGAPYSNSYAGAAYIYIINGASCAQQAKLIANDESSIDNSGYSVAISDDTTIIGAPGKNSSKGAAYVYIRNGTSWTQQAELTANDGASYDNFGNSVAISGDTAIVGSIGNNLSQGAAYIYIRNGTAWTQQAKLTASTGTSNDFFGSSVAISDNTTIVGANVKNSYKGAAYIYVRNGTSWTLQSELTANDGASYDNFGNSVAISGNTAIVGSYGKKSYKGAAYIYVSDGASWTQQTELTASDGTSNDIFGHSVAISGDTTLVGAPNRNSLQGVAYMYVPNGTSWTQQAELIASDGTSDDYLGYSLAISSGIAIVSAWNKNSAYIYFTNPVTYAGNGNTSGNPPVDNTIYLQGQSVTVLNNGSLRKKGYNFAGWNTEPDGIGIDYHPGNTFTLETENIILYAKWAPLLSRGIKLF